jgi:4-amino-4-deoxy-L-arabinose transferase-like glycosyltransferase
VVSPNLRWLSALSSWLARHPAYAGAIVFVIALVPRLYVGLAWAREPVWDGHYYHLGARAIAEGIGYGERAYADDGTATFRPWCHYPVGYSAVLAVFYAVFGATPGVATAAGAIIGATTSAAVHRLARAFLGPGRALIAGLLCALHPGLVLYAGLVMTEPLAALGLILAPLAYLELRRRPLLAAVAAGAVLGLTTLVRPQTVLCAPAIALLAQGRARSRLLAAAMGTAACLAVVAPWTARNCKVMDGCAFVSTNAGWNLAIGSKPGATGRFDPLSGKDGCPVVTGQVQQDRCWAAQGHAWIREDPARWLALAPKKLSHTFDHQSFAVGYLAEADPAAWPEERRAFWRATLGAAQYALLLFAALGALLLPRGRPRDVPLTVGLAMAIVLFTDGVLRDVPRMWPLAVAIPLLARLPPRDRADRGVVRFIAFAAATLVMVHVVFFGEDRYQVVLSPALCVLAAAAFRIVPEDPPAAV